ncbi:hypothetical protein evm_006861 [Chilo suppressalis]|nr:hypothetical protein evm_006861 [Chilo suppressalis]
MMEAGRGGEGRGGEVAGVAGARAGAQAEPVRAVHRQVRARPAAYEGVRDVVHRGRAGDGGRGQRQEGVQAPRGRAHARRDAAPLAARPAAAPPAPRPAPAPARQEKPRNLIKVRPPHPR